MPTLVVVVVLLVVVLVVVGVAWSHGMVERSQLPQAVALRPRRGIRGAVTRLHCSPRSPQEQTRQMAASEKSAFATKHSSISPLKATPSPTCQGAPRVRLDAAERGIRSFNLPLT